MFYFSGYWLSQKLSYLYGPEMRNNAAYFRPYHFLYFSSRFSSLLSCLARRVRYDTTFKDQKGRRTPRNPKHPQTAVLKRRFIGTFSFQKFEFGTKMFIRSQNLSNRIHFNIFNAFFARFAKKVWILSFFTLKLPEAKKIEIFPTFQRWMKKKNILRASHRKCIFLSATECHNDLLNELARAVLGNIGPLWWQYGPRFARYVLPRARTNIPPPALALG